LGNKNRSKPAKHVTPSRKEATNRNKVMGIEKRKRGTKQPRTGRGSKKKE